MGGKEKANYLSPGDYRLRHLWLNLSGIKECDKAVLLCASPSGLFGTAVEMVVDRFREWRMVEQGSGPSSHPLFSVSSAPHKSIVPFPGTSSLGKEQKGLYTCLRHRVMLTQHLAPFSQGTGITYVTLDVLLTTHYSYELIIICLCGKEFI